MPTSKNYETADNEADAEELELFEELEKTAAVSPEQVESELQAWKTWKQTKDPQAFEFLVNSYQNVFGDVYKKAGGAGSTLPKSAIQSFQLREFVKSLESYKPTMGTKLNTHVNWGQKRTTRYIREHKNVARITDDRQLKIGTFKSRDAWLTQQLGRPPSTFELADDLAESPDDVVKMRRDIEHFRKTNRKELSTGADFATIAVHGSNAFTNLLERLHPELTAEQQVVMEHRYGMFGRPAVPSLNDLGKSVGMTSGRVRTVHRQIKKRVDDLLAADTSWRMT
jgi:DNA-directed RNA polymerase specialized sigma subunit